MRTISTSVSLVFVFSSFVAAQELHASYRIERVPAPLPSALRTPASEASSTMASVRANEAANIHQSNWIASLPLQNPSELLSTGKMVGRVLDRQQGLGLVHLSILATHEDTKERHETRTDSQGEFEFQVLSSGSFRVRVGREGNQQEFVGVRVVSDRVTMLDFRLSQ